MLSGRAALCTYALCMTVAQGSSVILRMLVEMELEQEKFTELNLIRTEVVKCQINILSSTLKFCMKN